jgi:hypothetical protein
MAIAYPLKYCRLSRKKTWRLDWHVMAWVASIIIFEIIGMEQRIYFRFRFHFPSLSNYQPGIVSGGLCIWNCGWQVKESEWQYHHVEDTLTSDFTSMSIKVRLDNFGKPDLTDRETVLGFATMAQDSYTSIRLPNPTDFDVHFMNSRWKRCGRRHLDLSHREEKISDGRKLLQFYYSWLAHTWLGLALPEQRRIAVNQMRENPIRIGVV